jgi:lipid-binding SYLF domain-containing protein
MSPRLIILLVAIVLPAFPAKKAVERVQRAAEVLDEVMGIKEQSIPLDVLSKAHCVAIIPGVKKIGLGLGGKYGKGVLTCRTSNNKSWTGPSTVRIEGGSIGFQIGGSSTDYVLLVLNKKGKGKLISSKFTLGADAAVAGGPVGRSAQAQTDVQMRAEILAYSRSRGAFAGISLEGATLRQDKNDNKDIYGKSVTPTEILDGDVAVPASVQILVDTLTKYSAFEH